MKEVVVKALVCEKTQGIGVNQAVEFYGTVKNVGTVGDEALEEKRGWNTQGATCRAKPDPTWEAMRCFRKER